MQISTATRNGSKACGRCGGSGEFTVSDAQAREIINGGGTVGAGAAICWRCGGTGNEATGFDGQNINARVMQSSERRDGTGRRRGTIDVVAVVTTYATPKRSGRSAVRAVSETIESVRMVGRMVDGTTFDKTVAGDLTADLHQRLYKALGASFRDLDGDAEVAALVGLGVIAETAA